MTCRRCPTCGSRETNVARVYRAARAAERCGVRASELAAELDLDVAYVGSMLRDLRRGDLVVASPPRGGRARWFAAGMEPQR